MAVQTAVKAVPHIREPFLVGSMGAWNKDRLGFLRWIAAEYGDVARFNFGPFPVLLINTPDLIGPLLVEHADDFDKGFAIHRAFQPVIGNGLINNEGAAWRVQRKLLAPPFQPRHIASYGATMVEYTERIQQGWADGSAMPLDRALSALTMSIVGKVLFDADVLSEADGLGTAITAALHHMEYSLEHYFPVPLRVPTPRSRRTRQALDHLNAYIQGMIDARRQDGQERDDFLSILLRARDDDGSPMSDGQIRDEALTLFVAGHETTSTTLAWAFYLLATHPEIYARLQAEADEVLGGRAATVADLPRLPYSLQVFKEAMRLYPPAYTIGRAALRDVDLAGVPVRKNEIIILSTYTIHRRPDLFADPDAFDPDRFTPENEKRLPRYAYLPFGAGPRVCIGNHFALMEGQLLLTTLAQRVTFRLVPGQDITPQPIFVLRPTHGLRVNVQRRGTAG